MERIEDAFEEVEDPTGAESFDPDPTHWHLTMCRESNGEPHISPKFALESEASALARVGLRPDDLPAGLRLKLMSCIPTHNGGKHRLPWLWCDRPSRPATKRQMHDHARLLQEALDRTPEERARLEQERWERDKETLRLLRQTQPSAPK
jgi:hypothetical protein